MSSRIVILVHEDTPAGSRNLITAAIKAKKVGYWHWFQFAWLIVDRQDRAPSFWRDLVRRASPDTNTVVLDADGGAWSSFGKRHTSTWIRENWKGST